VNKENKEGESLEENNTNKKEELISSEVNNYMES
jgi:hypothetical protein